MYSTLILEFSGEIAKITLNRPDKRNAINTQMIAELQSALDAIEKSHSRVVIVTGAGASFCAGMDLEMLAAIAKQSPAENQEDSRRIAKMLRRLWGFPRPRQNSAIRRSRSDFCQQSFLSFLRGRSETSARAISC